MSNFYTSRVDKQRKYRLVALLHIDERVFPFPYLGVPLHSKKLNTKECWPLVNKIMGGVNFWSSRLHLYAWRVQLVRSVIGGMKNFKAQIFYLHKKLIKMVKDVCHSFI